MSTTKKIVAIYSNLPSGGATKTELSTSRYLSKYFDIVSLREPNYKIKNFISYLYVSLIISPLNQKKLISKTNHNILLVYHSWLTKSPSILRYSHSKKVYICHEPMREYYDIEHIKNHNYMEKVVNILRLPIKWLDRYNIQSANATIVANSYFSKNMIKMAYGINSIVVYPGVDINKYNNIVKSIKTNQVICVSTINKYKRQEFLVDVIANISPAKRPVLVLLGNGSDEKYLSNIVNKAALLNVKLLIKVNATEEEKIRELKKSKIFIYAPVSEPFGLVVEEAIAVGLPLMIYKNGGGYSEIVSQKNGIVMNNLNPILWSYKLDHLLMDNEKQKIFSKNNVKYAMEKLNSNHMNEQLLSIIEKNL